MPHAPSRFLLAALLFFPLAACASRDPSSTTPTTGPQASSDLPPPRVLALVDDRPIALATLHPALAEAAGSLVFEEQVLDLALERRLQESQRTISPADIERERTFLRQSIQSEAQADDAQAERLLQQVRITRGLGPTRYASLLKRNAALRALVRDSVTITPEQEALEVDIATKPRVRARYYLHERQATVRAARDQLLQASTPADRDRLFAELAAAQSQDQSAPRGGLLAPLSLSDPSVPRSLRQALATTREGNVSDVLAVPGGFAILLNVGPAPAERMDTPEERTRILATLRSRLERLAMDNEAQRLLAASRITILDSSLDWSWQNRAR